MYEEKFIGKINSDDSDRELEADIRDALNMLPKVSGQSGGVRRENVKGNLKIDNPFIPDNAGENKTLGSFEDKASQRIIFFNYDKGSSSRNGIYLYDIESNSVNAICIEPTNSTNGVFFEWNEDTVISGVARIGDNLIFCEKDSSPKKINIKRGINTWGSGEKKEWRYLIPKTGYEGNQYDINIGYVGGSTATKTVVGVADDDREVFIGQIESFFSADPDFDVEVCDDVITITEATLNSIDNVTTGDQISRLEPLNHYYKKYDNSSEVSTRYFELINEPFQCAPTFEYRSDNTVKENYIGSKTFQFATRVIFKDDTKSTISPLSKISLGTIEDSGDTSVNNYIRVNFSQIFAQSDLSIIKNVEIIFREGNIGNYFTAEVLEPQDFYEGTYDFYNDGSYSIVETLDAGKLFDTVPLKANTLETLKNFLFLGGYTEGYDTPCVDAKVNVDIDNAATESSWTIRVYARITNQFNDPSGFTPANQWYQFNQPIYENDNGDWVFGGFSPNDYQNNTGTKYGQFIPQGGFTVYLAGTKFRATTTQVWETFNVDGDEINVQTTNAEPLVYDGAEAGANANRKKKEGRAAIRELAEANNNPANRLYSYADIKNVPPGKYILRVASHKCYEGEDVYGVGDIYRIDDNNLRYQQTSARVLDIEYPITTVAIADRKEIAISYDPIVSPFPDQEIVIELGPEGGIYDISEENGTIITIEDITDPNTLDGSVVNDSYVIDTGGNISEEELKNSVTVENAAVGVNFNPTIGGYPNPISEGQTDHNGYFWQAISSSFINIGASVIRPFVDVSDKILKDTGDATMLQDQNINTVRDGTAATADEKSDWASTNGVTEWVIPNRDASVTTDTRTRIEGKVLDGNGNPVAGYLVLATETGRFGITDSLGEFEILVYSETVPYQKRRDTTLLFSAGSALTIIDNDPSNASRKDSISINAIDSGGGNFNNANPYILPNSPYTFNVTQLLGQIFYKRGGVYQFGVVYYDKQMRSSFVSTDQDLQKRIPFFTEDLNASLPELYPDPDTFKYGRPVLSWEINNRPPEWAYYYQLVRTRRLNTKKYLQWTINDVRYVISLIPGGGEEGEDIFDETTYSAGNANEVYLDLTNLLDYRGQNTDSKLAYVFTEGDRLIIYRDENGEYLNNYIDLPIRGTNEEEIIIEARGDLPELKAGYSIEIYSPKLEEDQDIYYEIGECYPVLNPTTANRLHGGQTQDQTASLPAKGTFGPEGDTYFYKRDVPNIDRNTILDFEHESFSDAREDKVQNIGRPNVVNKDAKQEFFYSSIRFSRPFIQDSFENGTSSFDALDKEALAQERGEITKMRATTNVILALSKNEATSVYILEGYLQSPDGSGVLTKTEKVIGNSRKLKGSYGTNNPESVSEYNDAIYFWDQSKGEWIRYSNNGLTPLGSNLKLRNKLTDIQKQLNGEAVIKVQGGFDPLFEMSLMTFKGVEETLAFSEKYNGFFSRFSFTPEWYEKINTRLFSFKEGEVWEHNLDESNKNTFYGESFTSKVTFVSNIKNSLEKIWKWLGIKSNNKEWTSPSMTNVDGQMSDFVKGDFIRRDDVYYADILRDKNTATDKLQPGQLPLLHGDEMRSELLTIEIENDSTEHVELDYVKVGYQDSPGHNVDFRTG